MVVNRGKTGFLYQAKLHGLHRQKTYVTGAPKRIRPADLLIGNQMPTAQSQQIKSFHDPATTLLPA